MQQVIQTHAHMATAIWGQAIYLPEIANVSEAAGRVIDKFRLAGGSAYAVIGIVDTMRYLKPDVSTICVGQTASTASLLLVRCIKALSGHFSSFNRLLWIIVWSLDLTGCLAYRPLAQKENAWAYQVLV